MYSTFGFFSKIWRQFIASSAIQSRPNYRIPKEQHVEMIKAITAPIIVKNAPKFTESGMHL